MNTYRSIVLVAAPLFAAACGGAAQPAATSVPAEPAKATPEANAPAPSASALAPAEPASAATTAPAAALKPATAADAAAACLTTATYDKKEPDKLTFSVKNTSDREVKMCWLEFYLYDKAGAQLAHVALPYNYKIAPGESDGQPYSFDDLGKQVGGKQVATIETVISAARFSDGAEFRDKSLAPDKRPRAAKQ
jgi:hypothetical protein